MLLTARARALLAFASVITPALALLTAAAVPAATPAAAATGQIAHRHVCAAPSAHHVACLAIIDTNAAGHPLTRAAATAAGLHPYMAADLQAAYRLPSGLLGSRQTIAIVDAYDDPNAESDLAAYRAANHLPPCTTANGCFKKVNQQGQQGSYPPADPNWAVEISLDLDMASAICPNCKIVLVEANSNNDSDMFAAENQAARLGANVISDSWGEPEWAVPHGPAATCVRHFRFPKVAITAGTGDSGFGVIFPSTCASVTAVAPTPTPPSPSTTPMDCSSPAGSSPVAPRSQPRSSPGCTRWPATPPPSPTPGSTPTTKTSTTSPPDPTASAAGPTCAPRSRATTAPPAGAPRTASAPSE